MMITQVTMIRRPSAADPRLGRALVAALFFGNPNPFLRLPSAIPCQTALKPLSFKAFQAFST